MERKSFDTSNLSFNSLLKALIRENFILKAQLGLIHDALIDKDIIEENELEPKLKPFLVNLDEDKFIEYLIETAELFEHIEDDKLRN